MAVVEQELGPGLREKPALAVTRHALGRRLVIAAPFIWLFVFFLVPFGIVLKISLSQSVTGRPPYTPVFDASAGWQGLVELVRGFELQNYVTLLTDDLYSSAFLSSLRIALVSTLLLIAIGYPIAYAMARAPTRIRPALVILMVLPFWTSFLIRVYAWIGILKPEGLLNAGLQAAGLIQEPLEILNTEAAIYIGTVYSYLPFMVLPLYAVLEKLDDTLLEAAADLGASPWQAFWRVTWPLSLPGIAAGSVLVFIPILGEFVIPDLLGGSETLMLGRVLWSEFFSNRDWPLASAVAILLLAMIVVPLTLYQVSRTRNAETLA